MLSDRSKILYIFILIQSLLFLSAQPIYARTGIISMNEDRDLVRIHDHVITLQELVSFAKGAPNFYGYLQVPGGPEIILEEMIWRNLFVLEGHDRGIPEPTEDEGGKELYVLRVKRKILPDFSPLTEADVRRFYTEHPEEFSSPLMLRVSQVKVFIRNGNEAQARKQIEDAFKALDSGQPFEEVARQYSEDAFSKERDGDLGFIPMEKIDPPELEQTLRSLAVGRISDIVRVGQAFAVYKITDRRDPVLDPYDQVSDPAREKAGQHRTKEALNRLRKELEAKWGVTYLDPEFCPKGR
jgi:hypothetical protein